MLKRPKLYIQYDDTDEVEVSEAIRGLTFLGDSTSPNLLNTYQTDAAVDGEFLTSQTFDKSTVTANFWLHFGDYYDYVMAKHEIYKLFANRRILRLRTDAQPSLVKYVRATPFEITIDEPGTHDVQFAIPFDNPSGYLYSVVNSDQLTADNSQFGMNLPTDTAIGYHFTTTSFEVFNASDIAIEPYLQRHELRIIINFTGDSLTLTNSTNGSSWSYTKAATSSDQIVLNGINTTLNGKPASANTDFGNITLDPGFNSITATGATAVDITFSFPFIYLA